MAFTDPIKRNYNTDDLEMLQRSQVFHDNYIDDEALFQAAFTKFDLTYGADFQTVIDTADAIPLDDEVKSDIIYVTNQILAVKETARTALKKLFTYVKIAFDDPSMLRKFGKNQYDNARDSDLKMKELLERAHRKASDVTLQAALVAVGYTVADVAQLQTILTDLNTLNNEQEDLIDDRIDKTQARVLAYNAVWKYMEDLNQASKVIFLDNPAKLTQYLLYPTSHPSLPKPQNPTAIVDVGNPTHAIVGCDAVVEATSYKLYFSEVTIGDPSGSFTFSTENATPSFDYPMTAGKRTYWKIRAFSASSSSDYSNEVYIDA